MKRLHENTAASSNDNGGVVKNSSVLTGFVIESEVVGVAKFSENQRMSHSYKIVVLKASAKVDNALRPLANGGFRFISPAQVKSGNDVLEPYKEIIARSNNKDKEWAANVVSACTNRGFVRLNLDLAPFKTLDKLEIHEDSVLSFKTEVGLKTNLIKPGSFVQVKSLQVKLWAKDLRKKKTPAMPDASAPATPAAPAPPAATPPAAAAAAAGASDVDDVDSSPMQVAAADAAFTTSNGFIVITPLFAADQVFLDPELNGASSSPEYNLRTLVPVCAQKLGHNKVIVLPFVDAVLADDAVKEGLIFDVNVPRSFNKEKSENLNQNDVGTYGGDKKLQLPINMSVTEYIRVPKTTPEAVLQDYAELFEGTHEDPEAFPNDKIFSSRVKIVGNMYPTQISKSGFALPVHWSHVNAYKRIPCTALVRLVDSQFGDNEKKAFVVHIEWGTKALMLENSFPVPLDFAWTLLGRQPTTGGITTFGMDSKFDGAVSWPIRNESNEERGRFDLLLANEANVDVAPYLDPANKWLARVMMVPNQTEFVEAQEVSKISILDAIAKGNACKTAEEGEAFVTAYVAKYAEAYDMAIKGFGKNTRRHRVFVWFYKPDEELYANDEPIYAKLRPAVKEPEAKKQKTDDVKK